MDIKKGLVLIFIVLMLVLPFIHSAQTVVVQQEQQPKEQKQGWFDKYFGFVKSPLFWGVVFFLILIMLFLVLMFFVIRWILKFLKNRSDIFYNLKTERMKLARIQRRYPVKLRTKKNTPIRLVRKEGGKLIVSSPIGFHKGDYITHEGNVVISMTLRDNKKWFLFPITDLLIIPDKEKIEFKRKDDKGKIVIETIENLPRARDIVQFNENEILVFAESLSSIGLFYVPVLKAKDGKVIDLSLPVYQSLKEVVLGNYLYDQTSDFVGVAKKSISLNPNLSYDIKSKDSSSSVDVPNNSQGGYK